MFEGEVDHAIRSGSRIPQAVEIIQRASMHLRPSGGEGGGRGIRASETDDVMTCL
jgi:hypothetical protein